MVRRGVYAGLVVRSTEHRGREKGRRSRGLATRIFPHWGKGNISRSGQRRRERARVNLNANCEWVRFLIEPLLMMFIFFIVREGSSAWPGGGEVSAGEEDDGQSRFRVASPVGERRLGLGVEEARMVTGGSGSGVGDPRLVSKTQGGSMTAEVVRTGGTTGGGRGLVTGKRCGSGGRLGRGG